ncbi:serine hydrolase domain-containing protein [Chitinophaga cymbidii]|uniref:Beta-lactamase-related domain-containing protein n=1 Tax=Chitinophaga cymbidii TaxID=1096750 RepID=A0A512RP31_9BACT|nr:serine hydrolase domain-containing protein [Chitinophaga cymbidii]GEP97444.1 hypothetical protein CCY01nite_37040 [Chitinophaga cymbidii]
MRKYFPVLLTFAILLIQRPAQAQSLPDSIAVKLNKAISGFSDKCKSPALAVCVVHENDIVYQSSLGYIDIAHQTPASIDAKFPIMSVTKTFTATMLMQLAERGAVKLDDDVRKYVPEYKVKSDFPGTGPTTLFQLVTHSAGLPRNTPADADFSVSYDRWMITGGKEKLKWFSTDEALLRSLQFIKLEYPPYHYLHHNDRHYSNLGYSVLGIALERAAKTDFSAYVRNNILKPLGMTNSGFLTEPAARKQVAKGYRYNPVTGATDTVPYFEPYSALYAGGMYATARDMCRFISFQFNDQPRVLSAESKARMIYSRLAWKPAYPYTLHEGAVPGYRSIVVFNPDSKVGWVILTNVSDVDFNQINGQIADIVNTVYGKKEVPDITSYVGTYKLPGGYAEMKISLRNDTLYSSYLQDLLPGKPMIPDGGLRFKVEGANGHSIHYEFVADDDGKVRSLKQGQFVWYKE